MDINTPVDQLIKEVKINRSAKRMKTISAKLQDSILYVDAPAHAAHDKLHVIIEKFKRNILKQHLKKHLNNTHNLKDIAEIFNKKYFSSQLMINSISYSSRQEHKFGWCKYKKGDILISHRLANMPDWVRDYVIVHELAHLIVPNHSKEFHELVMRYPLAERAKGFLIAKGFVEAH